MLRAFEKAYRRYNCRVFLVDNLMTVHLPEQAGFYQSQADFTIKLRKFAEARRSGASGRSPAQDRRTGGARQ